MSAAGDAVARGAGGRASGAAAVRGAFWSGPWPLLLTTALGAALRFGFTSAAGPALAGTFAVPVLFDAVRRAGAGRAGALAAAAALALMPESVLASGSADAVVALLVVGSLWLVVAACLDTRNDRRRLGSLLGAGGLLGAACATRAVDVWPCLPALLAVYGLGGPPTIGRRARESLAAAGLGGAVAGVLIVTGARAASLAPPAGLAGSDLTDLVSGGALHYDSVFGDVLVAAVAIGVASLLPGLRSRTPARGGGAGSAVTRLPVALAIATAVWVAAALIAFAVSGLGRYLESAAPALAIVLGLGTARLAGLGRGEPDGRPATVSIALALAAICAYAFHFASHSTSWGTFALLEAAVGAALLTAAPGRPRAAGRWLVGVLVVACSLVVPTHETLALVRAGASHSAGIAGITPARSGATSAGSGGGSLIPPVVSVSVSSQPVGAPMPPGFLGFSFEYPALISYAGSNPAAIDPVLLTLVRNLNPAGAPVLRIGGDSTDHTWWPVPGVRRPGGVSYSITPKWLAVARSVAGDLGGKLILGINLAADRPDLAAAEARALVDGIGTGDIKALEIGNEADVYNRFPWYRARSGRVHYARSRRYNLSRFIAQFSQWRALMPSVPLAGPTFARPGWMAGLNTFLTDESGLGLVTFHRYPTRGCESNSSDATFASIPHLMDTAASGGLADQVKGFVATAHARGLPFRLDELNSASCAGKLGVSNTFASSLWVLETLFNLASVGVDGINIHTLPGAAYQPFLLSDLNGRWTAAVRPLYYGLLMFARAFPPGAHLLSLQSPSGAVHAWATRDPSGHVHAVLVNDDPKASVTVRVALPGPQVPVRSEALRAPSLDAVGGVTLDGQSFGDSTTTGVLPDNPHPTMIAPLLGAYLVSLPPASAVMLSR